MSDPVTTPPPCPHCKNGWFEDQRFGCDVECVNGVLIDIDVATDGWPRDVEYPAAPCVSKSGKWPKRDRGCQARLEEWAEGGRESVSEEQNPLLTHAAFVGYAARLAQKASAWAADTAQSFKTFLPDEPMRRGDAMRFLVEQRQLLDDMERQLQP